MLSNGECNACGKEPQEAGAPYCDDCSEVHTCEAEGCEVRVDETGDLCHGCEADLSHRWLWGSGIPMGHHKPS